MKTGIKEGIFDVQNGVYKNEPFERSDNKTVLERLKLQLAFVLFK